MVYKRKAGSIGWKTQQPFKRRRYGVSSKWGRKRTSKRLGNKVMRLLSKNLEKHRSFVGNTAFIDTNGAIFQCVSAPGVGEAPDNFDNAINLVRDGRKIKVTSMRWTFDYILGDATNIIRTIIFKWKTSGMPQISDVLENLSGDLWSAGYKRGNRQYRILYDRLYNLHTSKPQILKQWKWKRGPYITYNGDLRTDWCNNMIFIIFISDSAWGVGTHPFCSWRCQTNFVQI